MKFRIFFCLLNITLLSNFSCSKVSAPEILFQENNEDWFAQGEAKWTFVDNELRGKVSNGVGFVMTNKTYDDFLLELEFKPDSTVNSGIFIRCKNQELSFEDCYEVNIWDLHPKQEFRTGAIVSRTSPLKKAHTLDQWNSYKIKNDKDHLEVWINDELMVDIRDKDLAEGFIALQAAELGEIHFRNIKLTTID